MRTEIGTFLFQKYQVHLEEDSSTINTGYISTGGVRLSQPTQPANPGKALVGF